MRSADSLVDSAAASLRLSVSALLCTPTLARGVAWLKGKGVQVDPIESDVIA